MVELVIIGSGVNEIQYFIIKLMDVGLEISLVVIMDCCSYYMCLCLYCMQYMLQVLFIYLEDVFVKWDVIKNCEQWDCVEKIILQIGEYLGNLSFNYFVSGFMLWKLVCVYNDGKKIIIQMLYLMEQIEVLMFLVVCREGGLFFDDEMVMVNYWVQGDCYIVDMIFDKVIFIVGVGSSQDCVIILRGN